MFLFPRALAFDFCYDLDICSQDQAMSVLSSEWVFPQFCQKYKGDFDHTYQKASQTGGT